MLAFSKDIALEVKWIRLGTLVGEELKSSCTAQWAGQVVVFRDPDQGWEGGWGHSWAEGAHQVLVVNPLPAASPRLR